MNLSQFFLCIEYLKTDDHNNNKILLTIINALIQYFTQGFNLKLAYNQFLGRLLLV